MRSGHFIPIMGARMDAPSPGHDGRGYAKVSPRGEAGGNTFENILLEILKGSLTNIPIEAPVIYLFCLFVFVAAASTVSQIYVRIWQAR